MSAALTMARLIALDCRNCPSCGTRHYYPQGLCRSCRAEIAPIAAEAPAPKVDRFASFVSSRAARKTRELLLSVDEARLTNQAVAEAFGEFVEKAVQRQMERGL